MTNPTAVALSVGTGDGGCLWPISSSTLLAGMACCVFMNSAPISASAAEDTMFSLFLLNSKLHYYFLHFPCYLIERNVLLPYFLPLVLLGKKRHCEHFEPCYLLGKLILCLGEWQHSLKTLKFFLIVSFVGFDCCGVIALKATSIVESTVGA